MGQAKDRHEHKGLELIIDAQHRDGRFGEGRKDLVEAHHQEGADGLHDHRGDAHGVDIPDGGAVETEAFEGHMDCMAFAEHHIEAVAHGQNLTGDGGYRRAQDAHLGQAEQAEDQNGVQNDVGDAAH